MKNCIIVSTVHTAISSFDGSLTSTSITDLGAMVIKAVIERARIDSLHADEVIMGNVLQTGLGQNLARQALLKSGLAETAYGFAASKVCDSGLKSMVLAAQTIQVGQARSIVVEGMEDMGLAPYLLDTKARSGYRLGDGQIYDIISRDGLMYATHGYYMGTTTENITRKYGITHEMQDELALHSQYKAAAAIESDNSTAEVIPVNVVTRKKTFIFSQGESPKADSTVETLGTLRPALDKAGTVTAGNASGINDGTAALMIMEESLVLAAGPTPLARTKSYVSGGVPLALMDMGPVPTTQKALQLAGLQLTDIDLIETNETFTTQFPVAGKTLGFKPEKVNVNGGAIALGHPIGVSGTRVLATLPHAVRACDKTLGPATLCVGGNQGIVMVAK